MCVINVFEMIQTRPYYTLDEHHFSVCAFCIHSMALIASLHFDVCVLNVRVYLPESENKISNKFSSGYVCVPLASSTSAQKPFNIVSSSSVDI